LSDDAAIITRVRKTAPDVTGPTKNVVARAGRGGRTVVQTPLLKDRRLAGRPVDHDELREHAVPELVRPLLGLGVFNEKLLLFMLS
jgi:hypothetical protein